MALPPHIGDQDQVVLFDSQCKLCNGWSRFLIRYDRQQRFKLCSVQSPQGQAILHWFGLPTDHFETMLLVCGPRAYQQSDAFLQVVAQMPAPWCYLRWLRLFPAGLRNWCYDRIALNRYRLFGKYDHCLLPCPEHLNRFLEHG